MQSDAATLCKECATCNALKPHDEFYQFKREGRMHPSCKPCVREQRRRYREENKDLIREQKAKHYAQNRDALLADMAEYRRRNAEAIRERDRVRAIRERERRREYSRKYHQSKRQDSAFRAARRERQAKRRRDPIYRMNQAMGQSMTRSLRSGKGGKSWRCFVDYSVDELRAHLERQFIKGMSWDNYGEWHIDHIVPLSSFTITGPDDPELRRAWALTNLRPLWARDNLSKSDRVETLL